MTVALNSRRAISKVNLRLNFFIESLLKRMTTQGTNVVEKAMHDAKVWLYEGDGSGKLCRVKYQPFDPVTENLDNKKYATAYQTFRLLGIQRSTDWRPHALWFSRKLRKCGTTPQQSFERLAIVKPRNILTISNKTELDAFIDAYSIFDGSGSVVRFDWGKIQSNGYYGVAFEFAHVWDIGVCTEEIVQNWRDAPDAKSRSLFQRYGWHLLYENETLMIWDLRALNNIYPVDIKANS